MPVIGDMIPRKSDTMTVLSGPGSAGANQVWDMSQTSFSVIQENTSVISPSSTPNGSSFTNANLAMTNDNASFLYFNSSSATFNCLGFSGDLLNTGTPIAANFSPDLTLHQFPRNYNSTFNDNYIIDVTIPGASINPLLSQIRFKRSAQVTDITDGWGIIHTPGNKSYDVLRVHTTTVSIDSIWTLPIFPPTWTLLSTDQSTSENYSWLAKGGKLAVAEMSFDTLGAPKIFKWTELPGIALQTLELDNDVFVRAFPNPFQDKLIIHVGNEILGRKGMIRDVFGKEILNLIFLTTENELPTETWKSGMYFLEVEDQNKKIKIVKD